MHALVKSTRLSLPLGWFQLSPHHPFQLSKDQGLLRVIGQPSLRNMQVVFILFPLFIVSFLGVAVASDQVLRIVSIILCRFHLIRLCCGLDNSGFFLGALAEGPANRVMGRGDTNLLVFYRSHRSRQILSIEWLCTNAFFSTHSRHVHERLIVALEELEELYIYPRGRQLDFRGAPNQVHD